jgi:alkanesulfonate monooxygenase SsuD/methylene tetrahydromethanopterin reductase-like flavin-dependent oxidoreductase (luciferase family)
MRALMDAKVDNRNRHERQRPSSSFDTVAPERDHRSVVVVVAVDIEQTRPRGARDGGERRPIAAFAHVDRAQQHWFYSRATMEIGLALPQFDFSVPDERPLRWETLLHWATRAETLGFDSVWLADHLFFSIEKYGGAPGEHGVYDPIVALGAIARATTRVRLGTLVLCVQLRPATVLAKALATLDVVSDGRLTVGLGAGWYEAEYVAAGIPFGRPGVRLAELAAAVETLKRLFAGDELRPGPRQRPRPPVWVGGRGDRLIELCAEHADGWNTVWSWTFDAYRERAARLDAACERARREPRSVARSLGLFALVGETPSDLSRRFERLQRCAPKGVLDGMSLAQWREGRLVGTVDEVREQLQQWAGLGVSTLVVGAGGLPFTVTSADDVEMLAEACSLEAPWEA